MKIAIPLNNRLSFYHNNPFTAPRFGIYTINIQNGYVTYSLLKVMENPWNSTNDGKYKKCQVYGACNTAISSDTQHITEHYAILQVVSDCDYLLADHYCKNISKALQVAGIEIYKIPPFIHKTDMSIKNFLLGVALASTFKHIHHAS